MMAQQLGQVAVGSIVKINENGSPVNYIVVHQGLPSSMYDTSCNGTWVLRQDNAELRVWNIEISNVLESSDIHSYLNNTWINRYDDYIHNVIKQVKIPYRQNGGSGGTDLSGANGLNCKIFLLSGREVGWDSDDDRYFPNDGAKLDYFLAGSSSSADQRRVATLDGRAEFWWLRSPYTGNITEVWYVDKEGIENRHAPDNTYGVRPAFVLPSTLFVLDDGTISIGFPTLTVPEMGMQGNPLAVSWTAVDFADGYILERKSDTDSDWVQVYSGANTSFSETAGTWVSVQYRVKAGVSGTYGGYTTSAEIPVVSASAVVISGSDGDLGTLTNDVIYTVSSDGTNPLTVVETINGMERTFTATNGAANRIHIFDLPTGSGTITIKATVTASGALVSATRNWTYTKTPMTFSDGGGMATLSQEGKTIFPKTLAEAVRMPGGMTLDRFIAAMVITLTTSGWTQSGGVYTQTVDCPIVWPYAPIVIVEPDLTTEDQRADDAVLTAWQSGPGAKGMKQGDGEITFYSASQPTMNIPVRVGVI